MTDSSAPNDDLGEVIITRDFDAPRELVFKTMIDPEHLTHFWGPAGTHAPRDKMVVEPWPGGRFETVMIADDGSGEFPTNATFVEVVAPERLSFEEPDIGMVTSSTFTDLGDGRTRVVIHQTNVPSMYRTPESEEGFKSSLDRFAAYLATLTS